MDEEERRVIWSEIGSLREDLASCTVVAKHTHKRYMNMRKPVHETMTSIAIEEARMDALEKLAIRFFQQKTITTSPIEPLSSLNGTAHTP